MRIRLDRQAVLAGTAVDLAVALPVNLFVAVLRAFDVINDDSNLYPVLFVIVLAGMAAGGYVAGRRQPAAPLSHGALAGLLAYLPIGIVLFFTRGIDNPADYARVAIFNAFMCMSAGAAGGYFVNRRPAR
jgi:putative membrane protein (TIGR04086 family)